MSTSLEELLQMRSEGRITDKNFIESVAILYNKENSGTSALVNMRKRRRNKKNKKTTKIG